MPNKLYILLSQIVAQPMGTANLSYFSWPYLDRSSTTYQFFYVNQMNSVLNFAWGQTSADDTCVCWNDKHHTLRKIRATFLSLSEEKKETSAGQKKLRHSRHLAHSLFALTKLKEHLRKANSLTFDPFREWRQTDNGIAESPPKSTIISKTEHSDWDYLCSFS